MSNNWKYASVPQRDRLSMIRSGNSDVYNSEKQRNKILGDLRSSLGLSTQDVDDWGKTIDNAYSLSQAKKTDKSGLPKFKSKYSDINKALNDTIKSLRQERDENVDEVTNDAESSLRYLEEWLANNGYSEEGYLSTTSKKEINDALDAALRNIMEKYEAGVESTRSKYRSMVM